MFTIPTTIHDPFALTTTLPAHLHLYSPSIFLVLTLRFSGFVEARIPPLPPVISHRKVGGCSDLILLPFRTSWDASALDRHFP
jgi:hypothetical protein